MTEIGSGSSAASTARRLRIARSRTIDSASLERDVERDLPKLQVHPPRLDLRQIQDLVEELEQVAPRAADVPQVFRLLVGQVAEHPLEQDVGEADDRVERGP